ncbi:MAG: hypothetical protein ABI763_13485 [Bacteroidota bacterium]
MAQKIKNIKRYNRYYKPFNFSNTQEIAEEEHLESNIELNENSDTLLEEKFSVDGELEECNSYVYNSIGKLVEHSLLYAAEDATEKRVLARDDKGKLLVETKYYGGDAGEHTEYVYNDQGEPIERKNFDEEGNFVSRDVFSYDDKGGLSEQVTHDEKDSITGRTTFVSRDDKTIEQCEYEGNDKLVNRTVAKFNDAGKEISSVQTTPEGKLISSVMTLFDDSGNVLEKQFKDFYSKTVRYQYDEQNRCTMQELFDGNGTLLRKNIYAYDDSGNLTNEQTYEMDTSRGGRDKHFETRYEYEFFNS